MRKVLVIEDNSDNLRLIRYALNRAGYEVIWAENGEAGITMAKEEHPAFILMDIMLPGMDGYEVARRIKASPAGSIPIIAITSSAMTGDREKVIAAGCCGYFEKPIDPLTIMEQIHDTLAHAGFVETEKRR